MQSILETRRGKRAKLYCASLSAEVARTLLANWPKAQVECGATASLPPQSMPQGAKTMGFYTQGASRGELGLVSRGPGAPNGPQWPNGQKKEESPPTKLAMGP